MGKSIAVGTAIGAGAGGLATAITAYVEKSNINCRVGDNLNQVGFGKSGLRENRQKADASWW